MIEERRTIIVQRSVDGMIIVINICSGRRKDGKNGLNSITMKRVNISWNVYFLLSIPEMYISCYLCVVYVLSMCCLCVIYVLCMWCLFVALFFEGFFINYFFTFSFIIYYLLISPFNVRGGKLRSGVHCNCGDGKLGCRIH